MRRLGVLFALFAAAIISLGAAGSAIAQDDMASGPHPAHIHTGGCGDTLGEVVYPLNDIGADMMMDGTPMAMDMMGAASAIPVLASVTTVEAALADIVGGEHAINVHESPDNMGNYVACGAIGGTMMGENLAIGLAEQNDSGLSGIAWLADNGDGTTTVTVFLIHSGMMDGMATPEA